MKETICGVFGMIGAFLASFFGGWSASMTTLLILMATDYITGLVVAGVFHKSSKSETGALESHAGWKGLAKKCMVLVFVLIANRLDIALGTNLCRDGVCIAYIINELLSIIENAGLMGVPVPEVLKKAIEVLNKKADTE